MSIRSVLAEILIPLGSPRAELTRLRYAVRWQRLLSAFQFDLAERDDAPIVAKLFTQYLFGFTIF